MERVSFPVHLTIVDPLEVCYQSCIGTSSKNCISGFDSSSTVVHEHVSHQRLSVLVVTLVHVTYVSFKIVFYSI